MKDTLTSLEDAFMRQALEQISKLVTESDRLKEKANAAWISASKIVLDHRGLELSNDTRIVVDKEEDGLTFFLQLPEPEAEPCEVAQEEPVLVE